MQFPEDQPARSGSSLRSPLRGHLPRESFPDHSTNLHRPDPAVGLLLLHNPKSCLTLNDMDVSWGTCLTDVSLEYAGPTRRQRLFISVSPGAATVPGASHVLSKHLLQKMNPLTENPNIPTRRGSTTSPSYRWRGKDKGLVSSAVFLVLGPRSQKLLGKSFMMPGSPHRPGAPHSHLHQLSGMGILAYPPPKAFPFSAMCCLSKPNEVPHHDSECITQLYVACLVLKL